MWTREQLKNNAKSVLKQFYWQCFAASLIVGLLTGVTGSFSTKFEINGNGFQTYSEIGRFFPQIMLVTMGISFILKTFVVAHFTVGGTRFYLAASSGTVDYSNLVWGFKSNYVNILVANLVRSIIVGLGMILFIVPGIILSLRYSMVDYILAEHPNISAIDVLRLSGKMTDGHKADIFVLELSFIGWMLLGVLACGFGMFFVLPYIEATFTQLYFALKIDSQMKGIYNFNMNIQQPQNNQPENNQTENPQ